MHRRQLLTVASALTAGTVVGCLDDGPANGIGVRAETHCMDAIATPGAEPDEDTVALDELVAGTNSVTFELFRTLRAEMADDAANAFLSPISITIALAMTYAGARGNTREQMQAVLRFPDDAETVHETINALQRRLRDRSDDVELPDTDQFEDPTPFELCLVNSLWGEQGREFEEPFLNTIADHYFAELTAMDFANDPEGSRTQINDWVAEHTNERIEELLPDGAITPAVVLVLVNAIYFMANWAEPFPEDRTETGAFAGMNGGDHQVPMMSHNRRWPYSEVDGTQVVELPYVGEAVSMVVILPPAGEFASFEADLDVDTWRALLDSLERREGTVRLPRFTFASEHQLSDVLVAMGMEDAFTMGLADFSGMASGDLFIDEVYHDAWISVDEEGTEAAAATAVVIKDVDVPADPFTFEANRPFLFAIRDRDTDTLLFLGRATDPERWEPDQ